ncbi:MAG: DUF4338 domain-containing protein [Opitutae bacterium]|nr:DUF4338 domain-containing protein [Opitutae bacterium]
MNWTPLNELLPAHALREITLRLAQPEEIAGARAALAREHYLGAPKPAECDVVQLAVRSEQVLAIVVWTRAARRLAARDAWVGWDARTRARRVPLLVQNNRFLVLSRVRQPNLASRVLGLAVDALPAAWARRTGVTPLLAETFVDPERYQGTCYKAAGWIEVGRTAGCGRHGDDYYVRHDQPKRLWLHPLAADAPARLREPLEPLPGEKPRAFGASPVPVKTATSLADALYAVADPRRRQGLQFPLHAMLAAAVLAIASGARTVSDLFRFVQELTPAQRRALRFRPSPKNRDLVPPPGEGCWRKVLQRLDPAELTRAIVHWQLGQTRLPPLLALDGKTLHRGLATLVTLCDAETGAPLVQVAQGGQGHEKNLAHALLAALPPGALDGAIVGGDALYADPALVRPLVQEQGAIALVQLKDNQPKAAAQAETLLAQAAPPFFRLRPKSATAASTSGTTGFSPSPRNSSASSTPPNCSKSSATA